MSIYNDDNDDSHYVNTYINNISIFEMSESINSNYNNIDNHIRTLWETVMVPYLENFNERQILDQLTTNDYNKFYEFMIKNNPVCQKIIDDYDNN